MKSPAFIAIHCLLVAGLLYATLSVTASLNAQEVDSGYGRRRGSDYIESVNGTGALMEMFRVRGHSVSTWNRLSPRIDDFDTIVWMPDDFHAPAPDAVDRLERWLDEGYNRTLIYVGRDFDAELRYWELMRATASAEDCPSIDRRIALARLELARRRSEVSGIQTCDWFDLDYTQSPRQVTTLSGDWAPQINASQADLWVNARMIPKTKQYRGEPLHDLLSSNGDSIASMRFDEFSYNEAKLIVVTNGSFLLNVPLVNHEHRELAGLLIDQCQPGSKVLFLESDEHGIQVQDREESGGANRLHEWMNVWPLNFFVFHFFLIGIIFFFTYLPIFGRPKEPPADNISDFGKHIESLGQLVRKSGDQSYALSRIEYYQEHVKRDSGVRHK
jgi:hypothetical protein